MHRGETKQAYIKNVLARRQNTFCTKTGTRKEPWLFLFIFVIQHIFKIHTRFNYIWSCSHLNSLRPSSHLHNKHNHLGKVGRKKNKINQNVPTDHSEKPVLPKSVTFKQTWYCTIPLFNTAGTVFSIPLLYFSYLITRLIEHENSIQIDNLKKITAVLNITLLTLLIFPHFNLPQILGKSDFGLADSEGDQHLPPAQSPLHCHPVGIQPCPWSSV